MSGSFFCPRCQARITSQGGSHATCPGCGLLVDLALADTHAGAPAFVPIRDLSGEWLGPYLLEAYLGSGGMGTVYRAKTQRGEAVAVKLLAPQLAAQPDLVERFQREARALAELSHPNIVALREAGTAGDQPYIAMELLAGESLEALLTRRQPTVAEALGLVGQIAEALAAAHAKGIIHRDLKPANIIVEGERLKVLDFGIAHVALDDRTLTRSDAILGTVNYMAPEQRTRANKPDHRADLFALGVIFYRLLTGQIPIGTFEAPSQLNRAVPARVDAVVLRLLQRDPDRRYPDAAALLAAIARLQRPTPAVRPAFAAAAGLALALGGAALWLGARASAPPPVVKTSVALPVAVAPVETPPTLADAPQPEQQAVVANVVGGARGNQGLANALGTGSKVRGEPGPLLRGTTTPRPASGKAAVVTTGTALRAEPTPKSKLTGKLAPGAAVSVHDTVQGSDGRAWAEITTARGEAGWVALADLSLGTKKQPSRRGGGKKAQAEGPSEAANAKAMPQGTLVGEKTASPAAQATDEPATQAKPIKTGKSEKTGKSGKLGGKPSPSSSSLELQAD